MAARALILIIDAGTVLRGACLALERRGLQVVRVAWDPAAMPRCKAQPAVVVIGPGVANPASIARRLRAAHASIHVVFVAPREGQEALRRTLLYSAPASTPWQLVGPEEDEVVAATITALESARQARQVRTTLDRVNLNLAAPAIGDAQAYRRLVVSDQYLASVLKHVQDAIISLDLHGNILSWNDGAVRVFGIAARDAAGEHIDRIAEWAGGVGSLVQAAVREGFVRGELHCKVRGHEVILDATFTAIEEHRTEVLAVAAILRDITDRKRTEATLAENEARFRALADNIPQLAWMTDETGAIVWYNQRWFDYTGTTIDEMKGWGWQRVHHPDHVERVTAKFRAHIARGEAWEDTFPLRSKDGEYRWFLSRAFPIRDAQGSVVRWFGTNTDVTEQRAAQQALLEADRRKNEFISMLSHELRNPLAPIRNSIFVLDRVDPGSADARRAHEVIRRQTDHLTRLVDDLLDVTRVTRGKMELAKAPVDLVALVRTSVEDYRPLAQDAGLELRLVLPPAPAMADVDSARIAQVLGNLLQNALKFTPSGGWIAVEMGEEKGSARIDVRDSGVGIDPQLMKTLFEPFVQGERSLARSQGGLGLGLAFARGIAQMHGGRLVAQSGGTDRGAQFTLWLPLLQGGTQDAAASPAMEAAPGSTPVQRVLIVDDNHDAADSLAELVKLFGHEAEVAYDGPSALEKVRAHRPDIVLCDIGLPGMSGYEVAQRIREEGIAVRLIAVSGYAQAADRRRAAAAGFHDHVAKPAPPDHIRRLLAGERARRQH